MCLFCEHPCWRDGGEAPCDLSDVEFEEAYDDYTEANADIKDWQDYEGPAGADQEKPE